MPMSKPDEFSPMREAQCVRCRALKPVNLFRMNAAGTRTAWCETCRQEAAKKWGIDEDMVEFAAAVYVYEATLRNEALVVVRANVAAGIESEAMARQLETDLRRYDGQKTHRIPYRMGTFLLKYRQDFYAAISMVPPEIATSIPSSVEKPL